PGAASTGAEKITVATAPSTTDSAERAAVGTVASTTIEVDSARTPPSLSSTSASTSKEPTSSSTLAGTLTVGASSPVVQEPEASAVPSPSRSTDQSRPAATSAAEASARPVSVTSAADPT